MENAKRFTNILDKVPNEIIFIIFLMLPRDKVLKNIMNNSYFYKKWKDIHIKEEIVYNPELLKSVYECVFCHYDKKNHLKEFLHNDEMMRLNNGININGKHMIYDKDTTSNIFIGYEIDYILKNSLYRHTLIIYEDGCKKSTSHFIFDDDSHTTVTVSDNYKSLNIVKKNILNNNTISEMNFILLPNLDGVKVRDTLFSFKTIFHNIWLFNGEHKEYFLNGNISFILNHKNGRLDGECNFYNDDNKLCCASEFKENKVIKYIEVDTQ